MRAAAVALRSFATSAGCTAGAPLLHPARMNVSTSAICRSFSWPANAGIGYAEGTPPITSVSLPFSVTLINDDASRSSTFGLPASGASSGA